MNTAGEPGPRPIADTDRQAKQTAVSWPAAGTAEVELSALVSALRSTGAVEGRVKAGTLPVSLGAAVAGAQSEAAVRSAATAVPGKVKVEVLDRSVLSKAVTSGVGLTLTRTDAGPSAGRVSVEVDYSSFAQAYGGGYGSRLQIVRLPACAATTPEKPACQVQTPIPSVNDPGRRTVAADVVVDAADAPIARQGAGAGAVAPKAASAPVYALVAGPSGPSGNFARTPLQDSALWTAGTSGGDFSWQYPIKVPAPSVGPQPELAVSYSSGVSDGKTGATNGQNSWLGEGMEMNPGFIERQYATCTDDGGSTGDLCWRNDNITVSLGGRTQRAFRTSNVNPVWKGEFDPGWRIEQCGNWADSNCAGTTNGTFNGEYWRVTTPEGTQYNFGKTKRFAGDTADTQSTLTVPVFGNNADDPCYNPAGFAQSWCRMGWRWSLDYVVDPRENSMTYFYDLEWHKYGLNNNASAQAVYRANTLNHIDYGTRAGKEGAAAAPYRVDFVTNFRCFDMAVDKCVQSNPSNWMDVPWDQACDYTATTCPGKTSPTFFSSRRLERLTTRVYDVGTGGYADVDRFDFRSGWPDPGDATAFPLWLWGITRTGLAGGTAIAMPEVRLDGIRLNNRSDTSKAAVNRFRVEWITSETGGITHVAYAAPNCDLTKSTIDNAQRCYWQKSKPRNDEQLTWEWWNKYVVYQVTERDLPDVPGNPPTRPAGSQPDVVTRYDYSLDSTAPSDSHGEVLWGFGQNFMISHLDRSWTDWRGYSDVTITRGVTGTTPQVTKKLFYRGLDGDRATPDYSQQRRVILTNSENYPNPDLKPYRGQLAEERVLDGATLKSRTIHDKRELRTAQQAGLPDGTVGESFWVRDRGSRTYTWVKDQPERVSETKSTFDNDGLTTAVFDLGDKAKADDDTCTTIAYTQDRARWMLALPGIKETRKPNGDACTGALLSGSKTFYGRYDSPSTSPGQGLPVRSEVLSDASNSTYVTSEITDFDALGRPKKVYDALNRATTTVYNPTLTANGSTAVTQTVVTNPAGHATTTKLDVRRGQPTVSTDANNKVTEGVYDSLGRLTGVWAAGRPKAQNPTPNVAYSYVVNPNKTAVPYVKTSRLGPNGNVIDSFEIYDSHLRLRQTQAATQAGTRVITDTTYNEAGLSWKETTFEASGGPTGGLVTFSDNAVYNQHRFTYDKLGRRTVDALYRQNAVVSHGDTTYDGDRTTVTPPAGGTPTTTYTDVRGNMIKRSELAKAGVWQDSSFTYDLLGRRTKVTDADGNVWTNVYDARGRVLSKSDPDAGSSTLTYDNAGQVLTAEDGRGVKLAYSYDSLGRKTGVFKNSTAEQRLATWTFDTLSKGQLTSSVRHDASGDYTTAVTGYDDGYRSLGTDVTIPASAGTLAGTYTTSTTYKVDGSPATIAYPAAGGLPAETVNLTYNNIGQNTAMAGLSTYVSAASYDFDGALNQQILGSGSKRVKVSTARVDSTRRLDRIQVDTERAGAAGTFDEQYTEKYTYDDEGNVRGINESKAGAVVSDQCFQYDGLRRMTESWTTSAATCQTTPSQAAVGGVDPYWTSYTFDKVGNRTTEVKHATGGDTTRTYVSPAATTNRPHSLTRVDTKIGNAASTTTDQYSYDTSGKTLTHNTATYTWDELAKLTKVAVAGGATTDFVYDADGNRILRKDSTGITVYLGATELHANTLQSASTNIRSYCTPGGDTLAVRTSAGVTWVVPDHHGTGQAAIDSSTLALTKRRSAPFGGQRGTTVTWPTQRGFVDGIHDPDTALVHIGARDYDPATGRFITVDPLFDPTNSQSWHGYAYANNAPATASDPTGLIMTTGDGEDISSPNARKKNHQSTSGSAPQNNPTAHRPPSGCGDDGYVGPCGGGGTSWACTFLVSCGDVSTPPCEFMCPGRDPQLPPPPSGRNPENGNSSPAPKTPPTPWVLVSTSRDIRVSGWEGNGWDSWDTKYGKHSETAKWAFATMSPIAGLTLVVVHDVKYQYRYQEVTYSRTRNGKQEFRTDREVLEYRQRFLLFPGEEVKVTTVWKEFGADY